MISDVEEDEDSSSCTEPGVEISDCSLPWVLDPGGMFVFLGSVHEMITS